MIISSGKMLMGTFNGKLYLYTNSNKQTHTILYEIEEPEVQNLTMDIQSDIKTALPLCYTIGKIFGTQIISTIKEGEITIKFNPDRMNTYSGKLPLEMQEIVDMMIANEMMNRL